jgi:1-acyl-sn-glycerol-3-phosphate acyltransferase
LAAVNTAFWGCLSLGGSLVDGSGRLAHGCMVAWARLNLRLAGVHIETRGLERLDTHGPQVLASNHQSLIDILALAAVLPVPFRFVAKAELFSVPFLGWHMRRAGYIGLQRGQPRTAARVLLEAARTIRSGVNTVIFPEGTRSEDGSLGSFKGGGFLLAIRAGVPVIPVGIAGSHRIVSKGSLEVNSGPVALVLGPPLPTSGLKVAQRDQLAEQVRASIGRCMEQADRLCEPAPHPPLSK